MKNKSIVDAWDWLGPNAVAENRVMAKIKEKQARRRRSLRWAMPAAAAAVLVLIVLAGTVFTSNSGNTFTVQAYALEEEADGSVILHETDLFDLLDGFAGYYDGDVLYVSVGIKYEGRNIDSVTFSVDSGFLALQHISDYEDLNDVAYIKTGSELVLVGDSFDIIGSEITFDGAMDDDLLLFWGMEQPDSDALLEAVELTASVRFQNGETQTTPVSVPLMGLAVIVESMDKSYENTYLRQVRYYESIPAEKWELIEDSVLPVTDGWYTYFLEGAHTSFDIELNGSEEFDENGDYISVYNDGSKVVIHHDEDGSLIGMVYRVPEELMYNAG